MTKQLRDQLLLQIGYITGLLMSIQPGEILELIQITELYPHNLEMVKLTNDLRLIVKERMQGRMPSTGETA